MATRRTSRRGFSGGARTAPAKLDWARGAVFNQTIAVGGLFAINMLSGWEVDSGYNFRGTVQGILQGWASFTGSAAVNATIAIGVIGDAMTVTPGSLILTMKEYPWMFYRRVMSMATPAASDTVQYGALSFPTETRTRRRIKQTGDQLTLFVENNGAGTVSFCHWSNILLKS